MVSELIERQSTILIDTGEHMPPVNLYSAREAHVWPTGYSRKWGEAPVGDLVEIEPGAEPLFSD